MLRHRTVEAIVSDIEGTTTALSFVKDVLFPYATEHLAAYVERHHKAERVAVCLNDAIETIFREQGIKGANLELVIATLLRWISEDRKHTALKTLQGYIWEDGYVRGDFEGHVYEDVPGFMKHLKERDVPFYIYSSGSVKAQELLFSHSLYGNLCSLISGYFDTSTGAKRDPSSYQNIIKKIKTLPEHTLFVSDVQQELDAAGEAGMQTMQILRDGVTPAKGHHIAKDFSEFWSDLQSHL